MRKMLVGFLIVGIAVSAFAGGAKESTAAATAAVDLDAREAPELAARVAAGELPPLAERLPENPLVVEPLEETGTYGGVWRNVLVGGTLTHVTRYQGNERLLRWTPEWDGIIPNIAESYDVSPDSRVFTFNLRKGMRWSDGAYLTADDFQFFYEDVISNSTLSPTFPSGFASRGEPAVFTKINDYAFRYTFKEPNGTFILGNPTPGYWYLPKHYLKEFHADYNPNADAEAKAAGFADWAERFLALGGSRANDDVYTNKDLPTLEPWVFTVVPDGTVTRA
ncbi:MAG: ABC transporter substrate-binding protein, partial [Spirochaetaceae bacterium]